MQMSDYGLKHEAAAKVFLDAVGCPDDKMTRQLENAWLDYLDDAEDQRYFRILDQVVSMLAAAYAKRDAVSFRRAMRLVQMAAVPLASTTLTVWPPRLVELQLALAIFRRDAVAIQELAFRVLDGDSPPEGEPVDAYRLHALAAIATADTENATTALMKLNEMCERRAFDRATSDIVGAWSRLAIALLAQDRDSYRSLLEKLGAARRAFIDKQLGRAAQTGSSQLTELDFFDYASAAFFISASRCLPTLRLERAATAWDDAPWLLQVCGDGKSDTAEQ